MLMRTASYINGGFNVFENSFNMFENLFPIENWQGVIALITALSLFFSFFGFIESFILAKTFDIPIKLMKISISFSSLKYIIGLPLLLVVPVLLTEISYNIIHYNVGILVKAIWVIGLFLLTVFSLCFVCLILFNPSLKAVGKQKDMNIILYFIPPILLFLLSLIFSDHRFAIYSYWILLLLLGFVISQILPFLPLFHLSKCTIPILGIYKGKRVKEVILGKIKDKQYFYVLTHISSNGIWLPCEEQEHEENSGLSVFTYSPGKDYIGKSLNEMEELLTEPVILIKKDDYRSNDSEVKKSKVKLLKRVKKME